MFVIPPVLSLVVDERQRKTKEHYSISISQNTFFFFKEREREREREETIIENNIPISDMNIRCSINVYSQLKTLAVMVIIRSTNKRI